MKPNIMVSVIVITYNQREFIRDTLEGILMQKTDFDFEVIVHDDCSTDGTDDIMREYEKKYPERFIMLYESENRLSQGINFTSEIADSIAKGEYVAYCEGDDYWTDPLKLQLQYDALKDNPDIDLAACASALIDRPTGKKTGMIRPKTADGIISMEDVIVGGGQYFATASLLMRREILAKIKYEFEKIIWIDYTWQLKGSLKGGAYYIDREMTAYRTRFPDHWTHDGKSIVDYAPEFVNANIEMLHMLDIETDRKYHDAILRRLKINENAHISFYDQLISNKDSLLKKLKEEKTVFLWGNGRRGDAFQQFCMEENVKLQGVCDRADACIGEQTRYDYVIVSTENVLNTSGIIVTSNSDIYNVLLLENPRLNLINLQEYIPWG